MIVESLRRRLVVATAAALFSAVTAVAATPAPRPTQAPDGVAQPQDFLRADIDFAVDPRKDFFDYANGRWLASHPIPASETAWGIGDLVQQDIYASLRKINEDNAAKRWAAGSYGQKVGDFWKTAMDTAKADDLGVEPLADEIKRIDGVSNAKEAMMEAFALAQIGVDVFFEADISQDEKNSDALAVHFNQGGLGLPERDFYFNPEAGVAKVRAEYVAHLSRVLQLLGRKPADADAAAGKVMAFETGLARISRKIEDLRDPDKNYLKISPTEFTAKYTPGIPWNDRLYSWSIQPQTVIVGQPEFFAAMDKLLGKTDPGVLRDYLRLHLVDAYSPYLSTAFDAEHFRFYGQAMRGQKEQRERWKRVIDAENGAMGMVIGQAWVADNFPAAEKQRYVAMVEAIRDAYRERIGNLSWMSPQTKAKALAKLAAITAKVGYPDKWEDFHEMNISRGSYCQNMLRAALWHFNDRVRKLALPVDRGQWDMFPQTYNAYYYPSNNEIVLPAAMFIVPGVADKDVDDAVAYGYVAAGTIGHEITHGFDDEGRKFDAHGNLTDWWTAEDAKSFQQRADVLVKQFDAYEPIPGIHINGKASLGENIADFGGVLLGLDAFKKTQQYKDGKTIGGLTPTQRFFLGYALGWMTQQREQSLRQHLLADVHAPAKWRVLGPLSNIPAFYEAFGVKAGDPMWRPADQRASIW
ncbi:MAG: M13 family metallopeptidase [Proteobacteria bacterium]|nr:M13 family metallopeptidase [Pseudomonadota bacterium]